LNPNGIGIEQNNSAIRFFYRNVLHILWDDIMVSRMILDYQLPKILTLGGGLDSKNGWRGNGSKFFLPIRVLSKKFCGKYMEELKALWENNKLEFHGSASMYKNHYAFKELIHSCYDREWISYSKGTFNGAGSVIRYLENILTELQSVIIGLSE